ncbi:hypothetical protein [Candidatus Manganitrophus noduliformans]|uniref:Uncharacterized protein n=1 Tax=Candidatus Manganitrophus noduliformans TaxID=2606439 RepID=A0A7X6DT69_9BACT|nr:hypothetical protein [Candidatus Manganitrophus noduliformans]NKE72870.1 hypothetical protein [Candidatus Manganitrophus noduliformans]
MNSNRSLNEEEHLKEIVSLLAAEGRDYLACQVVHLAGILKEGAQSFLPILRWGYLLAKGHLSEREAVSLLTALYAEARSAASGESEGRLLSLLAQSRDGMWLAERLREEIARQEEKRKTNRIPLGGTDERLKEGEGCHEEVDNEGAQKEDDPRVLPRPSR